MAAPTAPSAAAAVESLLFLCQSRLTAQELACVAEERAVLVDNKLRSPDIIASLTVEQLTGAGMSLGAAAALKKAFPSATGATGGSGNVDVRVVRDVKMIDAENPSVHLGKITLVNDKVQIAAIKEVLIAKGMCLVFVDGYAPVMDSQGWSEYKVPQNAESITLTTGPKPGTKVFPAYGAPRRGWSILPAWTARA